MFRLVPGLFGEELAAHYPTLEPCVSFAGRLRLGTTLVDQLSYVYTCATKPDPQRIRRP